MKNFTIFLTYWNLKRFSNFQNCFLGRVVGTFWYSTYFYEAFFRVYCSSSCPAPFQSGSLIGPLCSALSISVRDCTEPIPSRVLPRLLVFASSSFQKLMLNPLCLMYQVDVIPASPGLSDNNGFYYRIST